MNKEKVFWEKKISDWEQKRYSITTNLYNRVTGRSIRSRLLFFNNFLIKNAKGKSVTELGCASAKLANPLVSNGILSYKGIDFALDTIQKSKNCLTTFLPNIELIDMDISDVEVIDSDIVFSLGLFDWLSNEQIEHTFKISKDVDFIHTVSEKSFSVTQLLHRIYVFLSYGRKNTQYTPRYDDVSSIVKIAQKYTNKKISILKPRGLSFCVILTTIPNE